MNTTGGEREKPLWRAQHGEKLRNVSAVLDEFGIAWIPGLLPAHNYQDALGGRRGPDWAASKDPGGPGVGEAALHVGGSAGSSAAAGVFELGPAGSSAGVAAAGRQVRPGRRDELNRHLGRVGEEMVFKFEYDRLCQVGRHDLAKQMDWPADGGEDHRGYDIRSFERGGEERLLEIKTTNGHARTRFWLSGTQYEVAAQNPSTYRVRRVFHFQNGAEMFDIKPPLDAGLRLIPDKYLAVPR